MSSSILEKLTGLNLGTKKTEIPEPKIEPKIEPIPEPIKQDEASNCNNSYNQTNEINSHINNLPELLSFKIAELAQKLELANSDIRTNLIFIQKELVKQPDLVTVMTIEERRTYFQGLKKQKNIEVIAKEESKAKRSKKQVSINDFI